MLDSYLEKLSAEGKSPLTQRQVKSSLGRFVGWMQAATPHQPPGTPLAALGQATEIDISNFKNWLTRNYKPNTVRQTLTHLKAYFEFLVENGEAIDNPVTHVKAPTEVQKAPKWLTHNEQNALVRAVRKYGNLRDLTLITFLLHTGLRIQEACNVRTADLILGERKGTVKVYNGKHNRYREVPLNADVRKVLAQYLEGHAGEYLFTNRQGKQMTTRAAQLIVEKYRNHTEIEHLTAHALRHTFCHELVQKKVSLDVVARLAGHVKNDGRPNIQQTLVY